MLQFFSRHGFAAGMGQLPLKALCVFEAVARCGSFKDAAIELCVSQSAVSHQIKHLEAWFDRPLFDRSGQRPQLLPHGTILANALQHSLHDIGAACQLARGSARPRALVIASIPSVAICWLIPRLAGFKARHPDISTRTVYAFHGQDIDFSQVDLAFVFANSLPDLPGHHARLFQPGTSVPVCSPALRDTLDQTVLTEAIIDAGLLHDADLDGWSEWLALAGLYPVPPVTGPVFEDFNLLRAAALAGQGVALCPRALIGTDLAFSRLVQLSDIAVNQNFNYYLIERDSNDPDTIAARQHFVTWVFDTLSHDDALLCPQTAPARAHDLESPAT